MKCPPVMIVPKGSPLRLVSRFPMLVAFAVWPISPSFGQAGSVPELSAENLAQCQADLAASYQTIFEILTEDIPSLQEEIEARDSLNVDLLAKAEARPQAESPSESCQELLAAAQTSNRVLLQEVDGARADENLTRALTERAETAEARLALVEADLAGSAARVAQLEARLASFGLTAEAGFSYVGGGPVRSFVDRQTAQAELDTNQRLTADRCLEAIEWLESNLSQGPLAPLALEAWVWEGGDIRVCRRTAAGVQLSFPQPTTESHLVVFK